MILEKGDMWSIFGKTDVFMITTNPIVRNDGAVVMGRGIALQVKERYPELPYDFGYVLKRYPGNVGYIGAYDFQRIYWFMVKDHWRNPASLEIIENSVKALHKMFSCSDERVDLNFPGIGNGKLKREDVLPLLEGLRDNIHIWEFT